MDKQIFIDRILETENLTDELEDSEADWLLNWGISKLDYVLEGIEDEEIAAEKVQALMKALRKVNRMIGSRADQEPEELAEELSALNDLFANAFDRDLIASEQECLSAARRLGYMAPAQAVEFLTRWGLRPISRM
jgi:hypothetical protein